MSGKTGEGQSSTEKGGNGIGFLGFVSGEDADLITRLFFLYFL